MIAHARASFRFAASAFRVRNTNAFIARRSNVLLILRYWCSSGAKHVFANNGCWHACVCVRVRRMRCGIRFNWKCLVADFSAWLCSITVAIMFVCDRKTMYKRTHTHMRRTMYARILLFGRDVFAECGHTASSFLHVDKSTYMHPPMFKIIMKPRDEFSKKKNTEVKRRGTEREREKSVLVAGEEKANVKRW